MALSCKCLKGLWGPQDLGCTFPEGANQRCGDAPLQTPAVHSPWRAGSVLIPEDANASTAAPSLGLGQNNCLEIGGFVYKAKQGVCGDGNCLKM